MKPLSDNARAILEAARRVETPTAELRDRTWAAITVRAAGGDLGPALGSEPHAVAGATAASKPLAMVAAGAATATALAAVVAWLGPTEERITVVRPALRIERPSIEHAPVVKQEPPAAENAEPEVTIEVSEIVETDAPEGEDEVAAATVRKPNRSRAVGERAPTDPGPNLGPEVALMAEARSALGAGDPALAVELFQKHARRFPRGVFARERDVSWIVALCALGREDEAKRRAKVFLDRHGTSALADRVRRSCGGQSLK